MVTIEGVVTQLMKVVHGPNGNLHQQFLINTKDGLNLKVKNNLRAGQEVPVHVGSALTIRGELLKTDSGRELLHWTHRSRGKSREGGWIMYDGRKYA